MDIKPQSSQTNNPYAYASAVPPEPASPNLKKKLIIVSIITGILFVLGIACLFYYYLFIGGSYVSQDQSKQLNPILSQLSPSVPESDRISEERKDVITTYLSRMLPKEKRMSEEQKTQIISVLKD